MHCSHEGACCGDRFLEMYTWRVLSQGHVVISFSDWIIFRSIAGTYRINSSHEAVTGSSITIIAFIIIISITQAAKKPGCSVHINYAVSISIVWSFSQ